MQASCLRAGQLLACGRKKDSQLLVCGRKKDSQLLACGRKKDSQLLACGRKKDSQLLVCGRKKDSEPYHSDTDGLSTYITYVPCSVTLFVYVLFAPVLSTLS